MLKVEDTWINMNLVTHVKKIERFKDAEYHFHFACTTKGICGDEQIKLTLHQNEENVGKLERFFSNT